jgi:hypothetical protein
VESIASALHRVLQQAGHSSQTTWYYPSIREYASLLEKHGFRVSHAWHFDRPTKLEDEELGLHNWLAMFASSSLEQLSTQEYETVLSHIEGHLRPTLFWQGDWYADYKRIRIVAIKK